MQGLNDLGPDPQGRDLYKRAAGCAANQLEAHHRSRTLHRLSSYVRSPGHAGGSRRIRLHDRSATTSTVPRNRIHHPRLITRFAAVVTALAGGVLAFGAAASAAFATLPP